MSSSKFKPVLDSLEVREVPAVITVTGTGDTIAVDGFVTLREAITAANTNAASGDAAAGDPGLDTIKFNIFGLPGTVHTIQPTSALPSITEAVFIDGYSQLGASPNTLANGTNAFLAIELDGTNAGFVAGLHISAGNSTVQGLVINRFSNEGILITGKGGNEILGNFLGTDQTGTQNRGNGISGVAILSSNNLVGDATLAGRNLVSGNDFAGVTLLNSGINGNVVQGNLIGTDDTGTKPLGNNIAGVRVLNVTNNTVGGTTPGAGNVIAFNNGPGVQVSIDAMQGNAILGNSIFGNSKLGIDLLNDGVTSNNSAADPLDADAGPNGLQNYPVLTSATSGPITVVKGTLRSTPITAFRIELFSNDAADPSGFGEGRTFLGFVNVVTNGSGVGTFTFLSSSVVPVGKLISATATDSLLGNTSEFSKVLAVTKPPAPGGNPAAEAFAVGAGPGAPAVAQLYNADGSPRFAVVPFAGYAGGVHVAAGDVNGDGTADLIVGAGPGAPGGHVKAFDGKTGALIRSFYSFDGFFGGVNVAAGDVNHDGFADIIVGASIPGGHVKAFDGKTGALLRSFFAFPGYASTVNVGAGDLDGDGFAEIIVGTANYASHVKAFDGKTGALVRSFFAFPGFTGGVTVAGGDVDGDNRDDIIVGAATAVSHVKAFSGATGAEIRSVIALLSPGVRVGAADLNNDGRDDIIAGSTSTSRVRVLSGADLGTLKDFFSFNAALPGGVFVG
jgi:hypothetical protein